MASICNRYALRLQRATNAAHNSSKRAFSQTSIRSKQLPSFIETPNAELNSILADLRTNYFLPKYLHKNERKLIFSPKNKQYLEENPQTAEIGGEEVELKYTDMSKKQNTWPLVQRAVRIMYDTNGNSWENLPRLLRALNEGIGKTPNSDQMDFIVRKAVQQNKISILFRCLQQSEATGMTLKDWKVLRRLVLGIRQAAQQSNWEKNHVAIAIENFQRLMSLLETEAHGGGEHLSPDDARRNPAIIGVLLELSAIYTYKHAESKDKDGVVKTYAERLISILEQNPEKYTSDSVLTIRKLKGQKDHDINTEVRHFNFMLAIPPYHGLLLAHKILGEGIPRSDSAKMLISQYQTRLSNLATELESRQRLYYEEEALDVWAKLIRD